VRILYLTDTREIGGAERNLADLTAGLMRAGHEVRVVAPQLELVRWLSERAPTVRVRCALKDDYHDQPRVRDRVVALARQFPSLIKEIRSFAPDVLHVNNGGFPGSDLCRLAPSAGRLAGVPLRLMTVHSNPWARDRSSDRRMQAAADLLVWSTVDTVVCPSEAVADGLVERRGMPQRLACIIYYGVPGDEPDRVRVSSLHARLAPNDELLVGMVSARPVPEKGYDSFLEALSQVRDGGIRAVLVGDAPDDFMDRAASLQLGDMLAWEGRQTNVAEYYAAIDVLVVPSTAEECMPLVILEAASVSTPTFGSRLSGIPEAIRDRVTGRLFDPGSGAQLAGLLGEARADRAGLVAMGQAAHQRWAQLFSLERMLEKTLAVYARSVNASRG
jgi:glycosyltransferase involved in cell wall biosynthesis